MPRSAKLHRPASARQKPPEQYASSRRQGKTTTQRGYGWDWQRRRIRILERDNYLCVPCSAAGVYTPATEVDHIVNLALGGGNGGDNLQSICKACHAAKTALEADAGRQT